ncbi:MAG: RidA family protein [Bacteroidetes bacterium]|nr:RidA family protein [Bacteroidota bacterium]
MQSLHSPSAPKAIGPYSQAIQTGNLIYCSGQTPINPETMQLIEGDISEQSTRVLKNLAAVLSSKNLTLSNVVKMNVYLTDMKDFQAMNKAYEAAFGSHRPARTTVAVAALPMGARVEMECVAEGI